MTKGEALKKMQAVKTYMTSGNPIWDVTEIGEAFVMAIEALRQPEIVRCKDCKYQDEGYRRVSVKWLPCMDVRVPNMWYCGSAERREE